MLRIVATIAAETRVELLARASLFAGIGAEPLAQLAASARTRESVDKQIRVWTDRGIVSVDRGYIVIHNPDALDQLAAAIAV